MKPILLTTSCANATLSSSPLFPFQVDTDSLAGGTVQPILPYLRETYPSPLPRKCLEVRRARVLDRLAHAAKDLIPPIQAFSESDNDSSIPVSLRYPQYEPSAVRLRLHGAELEAQLAQLLAHLEKIDGK